MRLLRKLRLLFRKDHLDAEMAEEMQLHVDMQAARNRRSGMAAAEACFAAQREFGNIASIQQKAREQRGGVWLEHLQRDLRHGWRMIGKHPGLSAVIILSLGIGIGANTVIFSWLRGLVFRPLPGVPHATEVLLVEPRLESGSYPGASWLEYRDLQARLPAFESLLAYRSTPLNYGAPDREERAYGQFVSGNFFSALGMQPALGRLLRPDETDRAGGPAVVVISHDFWLARFGGSPDTLGKEILVNERRCTIVGVAPQGFRGMIVGLTFDLFLPATMVPELLRGSKELEQRENRGYSLAGRLRPGATSAGAGGQLDTALAALATEFPVSNGGVKGEVLAFWRAPRGAGRLLLGGLAVLQGFMLLVLAVVCANAANLLLARASARRREIGVRLALGARPGQILRQFLVESLLLGGLAAIVGTLLAWWGNEALRAVPLPGALPFKFDTRLEWAGLAFSLLLGPGCAFVFGLVPAVKSARTDAQLALRVARSSHGRSGLPRVLVATEVALALLVLMGAALMMRSFLETRTADPGFKAPGVLLGSYDLSGVGYDRAVGLSLTDDLLHRLTATPGVESAAIASWVPLDFHAMPSTTFTINGRTRSDGGQDRALGYSVTPGYFTVMGLPLVAGRDFTDLKDTAQPPQAVVNEEFVRRFLAGSPALGHQLATGGGNFEIVGVVRNSLYETFGEPLKPIVYFSYRERFRSSGELHVRWRNSEPGLAPDLRRLVREANPAITLHDIRTLTEHVDKNLFFRRIPARMFAVLGPLILFLAAVGIYAVVACAVAQRTTEIGVRLALGASSQRVVREIVRETLRVVWFGLAPAWFVAFVVMLHVRGGILNAPILLGVPLLLVAVAALAAWLPARRAAKVDPMVALRAE